MSSPGHEIDVPMTAPVEETPIHEQEEEDEGEGDVLANGSDDSSEEPEEDAEEERRVREGFIVDEDEEEEAEMDRRPHKRRKKHRRRREKPVVDDLDEDDLDLLEENTGPSKGLTRLRRGTSPSEEPRRKSRPSAAISDEDEDDLELPQVQDIHRIWDDERTGGREDDDDVDMDDMDNFIDYEDEEDGQEQMDEQERKRKRKEAKMMRAKAIRGTIPGVDANAFDEIHEVFGDGHDYDWALDEEETRFEEDAGKPEMRYHDVFEPSEIRARFLTEDDDLIRAQDIPERMQLTSSSLSLSTSPASQTSLSENDLEDAAVWVVSKLEHEKSTDFFDVEGRFHHLLGDLYNATQTALKFLFVQHFEVPYIWIHRRDWISYFNPQDMRTRVDFLTYEELWRVQSLGQKYCALIERRKSVDALYSRLEIDDDYFNGEVRRKLDSVEMVADAIEWLNMKYKEHKRDLFGSSLDGGEENVEAPKHKLPSRISAYEVARKSVVSKLADNFGIKTTNVVLNYQTQNKDHFIDDPELSPEAYAEQFSELDVSSPNVDAVLARARMILATELGKDPILRQETRKLFKSNALVSCTPTERGIAKIEEHHPFFSFKYLKNKPVEEMSRSSQFLHILTAEAQHAVTISISLDPHTKSDFENRLISAFASDGYSETAAAWNEQRATVVREAMEQYLVPIGIKFTRDWLREEAEDFVAWRCATALRNRIDVCPYATGNMRKGETPSVLAMSWGSGDIHKDDITVVFLDQEGRMRDHTRIANLTDHEPQEELLELIQRRKPEVVVIGGFTIATTKLVKNMQTFVQGNAVNHDGSTDHDFGYQLRHDPLGIPVIYVHDEVARLFQHSKRAEQEFGTLSTLVKYCVGLARFAQSPLNEYAALGEDITAISFDEESQNLVPKEKMLVALERAIVETTNDVGVDINRAVIDSYYGHLLPFVCGLGPRKSQQLVKSIANLGGTLVNREQFIKASLLTTTVFLNAAAFLRIDYEDSGKSSKHRHNDDTELAEPLDNTRIHPEDYDLARKMATDALELDEEDVEGEHPSYVVSQIMQAEDRSKKLSELNLDDFAVNMFEVNEDRKRHTLDLIRQELSMPFSDHRDTFPIPTAWDVLTMLTGQTPRSLNPGLIVSCQVVRVTKNFSVVRLDSGIEGRLDIAHVADIKPDSIDDYVKKGEMRNAVVVDLKMDLVQNEFGVEVSVRPGDLELGDIAHRRIKPDKHWDYDQLKKDQEMQARKKRAEVGQQKRIIKHPQFHDFNSVQAEAFLSSQQRGDAVIRSSSRGINHLAVTWKVDDKLYQHIDVSEPDADPSGRSAGTRFLVEDGRREFADLDELIVNYVQAMARKVEELMAHDKYKHGEDELHHWLRQFVKANPSKSIYGFTLNRKRPGHFNLCFLANSIAAIQTWPVRVTPEAYFLYDTPVTGVSELCDAFKIRYANETQNLSAGGGAIGKTPYGAGGRTPARTPGHATPGRMSVRAPARTPNPYASGTPVGAAPTPGWAPGVPAAPYGAVPPPAATPFGYQTPSYPPAATPMAAPAGMNPERARLIRQQGGF